MWNGSLVVDAVAHSFNWIPENRADSLTEEEYRRFLEFGWQQSHLAIESDEPGWKLSFEEYTSTFTADTIARSFIEETEVDMIAYHEVEIPGVAKHGLSPLPVGEELKRRYPERVLLYVFVDPFRGEAEFDRMEAKVATGLVDGFKFYPTNGVFNLDTGKMNTALYDDPEFTFPFFQKAIDLGVHHVAIHKAYPVGPGSLEKDKVDDVGGAAASFPQLTFEVVHSGWAFLEDCALQMMANPNIYANLELTANFAVRRPRQCAESIGELLRYGTEDRLIYAAGIPNGHPQPVFEAFSQMEMPEDLVTGQDMTVLSEELKKKILGTNMLALHGIDPGEKKAQLAGDEWDRHRQEARARDAVIAPWRAHREAVGTPAAS
jgi:predicted TIM-barrel fold metal-dependent hydrolase